MPAEETRPITAREAAAFSSRLQRIANAVQMIESVLSESKARELWMFRKPSLEDGLRRLEAALPEIERSVTSFQSGYPLDQYSEKGRKKPGDPLAEGDMEMESISKRRASRKKKISKPSQATAKRKKKRGAGE